MTNSEIVTAVRRFIRTARQKHNPADVAYGYGALDALQGRPADGARFEGYQSAYLSGWLKIEGI